RRIEKAGAEPMPIQGPPLPRAAVPKQRQSSQQGNFLHEIGGIQVQLILPRARECKLPRQHGVAVNKEPPEEQHREIERTVSQIPFLLLYVLLQRQRSHDWHDVQKKQRVPDKEVRNFLPLNYFHPGPDKLITEPGSKTCPHQHPKQPFPSAGPKNARQAGKHCRQEKQRLENVTDGNEGKTTASEQGGCHLEQHKTHQPHTPRFWTRRHSP